LALEVLFGLLLPAEPCGQHRRAADTGSNDHDEFGIHGKTFLDADARGNSLRYFWAFFQSARKVSSPLSVNGCLNIASSTFAGIVPTCAPASAACTTCIGCRNDAASTCVL